jgi:hypothetical protein
MSYQKKLLSLENHCNTINDQYILILLVEFTQHRSRLGENVSVIVCGEETKFLHYYTNQYAAIKQSIGNYTDKG